MTNVMYMHMYAHSCKHIQTKPTACPQLPAVLENTNLLQEQGILGPKVVKVATKNTPLKHLPMHVHNPLP